MKQTASRAPKKTDSSLTDSLRHHAAVRLVVDRELPRTADDKARGYGRDFSQMPSNSAESASLPTSVTQSPPFTLQRCPFGGAYHASPPRLQAKLTVNKPGDIYEQEADRIAKEVTHMPTGAESGMRQNPAIANRAGSAADLVQRDAKSPDEQGDCTGWLEDPESLVRRAARQYWLDIGETKPPTPVGKVDCKTPFISPNGKPMGGLCWLEYDNGVTVSVGRPLRGGNNLDVWQTKSGSYSGPVCMYRYYCTKKQGTLVLEKKACYDPRSESRPEDKQTERESGVPSTIQRSSTHESWTSPALSMVRDILSSPGRPLDVETRSSMEVRFGRDFSRVRVHSDSRAAESAQALNARAYTLGQDVVFGAGQFMTGTTEGRRLLAHELVHVVQQSTLGNVSRNPPAIFPHNAFEQDAEGARAPVDSGARVASSLSTFTGTPRLQRQPAGDSQTMEEEYEEDRKRFEEARAQHGERLREARGRDRPHVLKAKGVSTTTRIDEDTAQLIQSALAESRLLRPYLGSKLGPDERRGQVRVTDGRFIRHDTLNDFAAAWATYTGRPATTITQQLREEAAGIGGFYDRATKKIHLNPKATLGDALHEALHKLSTRAIEAVFGQFLNEGVTQYFTDQVLIEHGLPAATNHRYGPQLLCATALVHIAGQEAVAGFQFAGKGGQQVRQAVINHLQISDPAFRQLVLKDQLCARITSIAAPGHQPGQNPPTSGSNRPSGVQRMTTSLMAASQSIQRKATAEGPLNGAANGVDPGRQSPNKAGDCSGWQSDPQSLSKVAAEHYVVTELGLLTRFTAGLVKTIECDTSPLCCREAGGIAACDVTFANGIVITVTIYPDRVECWRPKSPRCIYDYACPPSGQLVLAKRRCS